MAKLAILRIIIMSIQYINKQSVMNMSSRLEDGFIPNCARNLQTIRYRCLAGKQSLCGGSAGYFCQYLQYSSNNRSSNLKPAKISSSGWHKAEYVLLLLSTVTKSINRHVRIQVLKRTLKSKRLRC